MNLPKAMDEICPRIKIIPTEKCLIHEGVVQKWVDQIADTIQNDGIMKNPIIVTAHEGHYVVLDGMHRFAALQQLKIPDILVFEVDYISKEIVLEPPATKEEVIGAATRKKLLPPKSTKHIVPGRPLRVDLDLTLLKEPTDLKIKNERLQKFLRSYQESRRARFYPEPVYVFAD